MTDPSRAVSVGRVGRAHGRDGSFYVDGPERALEPGDEVTLRGRPRRVERRGGTAERPLVRLSGVEDRETAIALHGERLLVPEASSPLEAGEWLAQDLVGLEADGLGRVRRVLDGASCSVLELDGGVLVPFVADAVRAVDPDAGVIQLDREFLGL